MTEFTDKDWDKAHVSSVEYYRTSQGLLEWQCRAVAKMLHMDEENWRDHIDIVYAVNMGRLCQDAVYGRTPEAIESFRNFMINRN